MKPGMMNSRRSILFVLAAFLGLGAGFGFRWWHARPAFNNTGTAQTRPLASEPGASLSPGSPGSPGARRESALCDALEQDLSLSSGVLHWLHWMTAMEKAELGDFPRLARLAADNPAALRLLVARWVERNPWHLFERLTQAAQEKGDATSGSAFPADTLGDLLMREWAQRDPDAVITALSEAKNRMLHPTHWKSWCWIVAGDLLKTDPERGLRLLAEWGIDEHFGDPSLEGVSAWAARNPRHAAEFAFSHLSGNTDTVLQEIGKVWAQTEPAAALEFTMGRRDFHTHSIVCKMSAGIIKEWAGSDPAQAAAWLTETKPYLYHYLIRSLVETWSQTDLGAAVDWIEQHLSGNPLEGAVEASFRGAVKKDINEAADVVAHRMEVSPVRARAAAAVARAWFLDASQANKPVPPEAVTWLSGLDTASLKLVVNNNHSCWRNADLPGFAAFLASPAAAGLPLTAGHTEVAREMTRRQPLQAIEWAGSLSATHRPAITAKIFEEWQRAQPAVARPWFDQLPADDPRRAFLPASESP